MVAGQCPHTDKLQVDEDSSRAVHPRLTACEMGQMSEKRGATKKRSKSPRWSGCDGLDKGIISFPPWDLRRLFSLRSQTHWNLFPWPRGCHQLVVQWGVEWSSMPRRAGSPPVLDMGLINLGCWHGRQTPQRAWPI